jgi:hypothetical protein
LRGSQKSQVSFQWVAVFGRQPLSVTLVANDPAQSLIATATGGMQTAASIAIIQARLLNSGAVKTTLA